MMSQPSEKSAIVGVVNPQTVANTEQFTAAIDMSKFREVKGTALLGNMATETVDFKVYNCDSAGNNRTQLKAATQLAAHATNNDNKQIVINVKSEEVITTTSPTTQDRRYICFGLVTGGATGGPAAVIAEGYCPVYGPASDDDLSSVAQIVI